MRPPTTSGVSLYEARKLLTSVYRVLNASPDLARAIATAIEQSGLILFTYEGGAEKQRETTLAAAHTVPPAIPPGRSESDGPSPAEIKTSQGATPDAVLEQLRLYSEAIEGKNELRCGLLTCNFAMREAAEIISLLLGANDWRLAADPPADGVDVLLEWGVRPDISIAHYSKSAELERPKIGGWLNPYGSWLSKPRRWRHIPRPAAEGVPA